MYYRYSTAFSHMFLSLVVVYCLRSYTLKKGEIGYYPILSYLIVLTNSLSGIWKWGNPMNGFTSNTIYHHTRLLQTFFTFPLIVTELWTKANNDSLVLRYLHFGCSFIIWLFYYIKAYRGKFVDAVTALNIISCIIVSFSTENWYGVSVGFSYIINELILQGRCEHFELSPIDIYNYALCFFLIFSLKALLV